MMCLTRSVFFNTSRALQALFSRARRFHRHSMQNDFRVQVFTSQPSSSFLEKGFLKCVVTQTAPPFSTREFAYCLHCRKLRSMPWLYRHKRRFSIEPTVEMQQVFATKFPLSVQDVITEVELLKDFGKLFKSSHDSNRGLPSFVPLICPTQYSRDIEQERFFDPHSTAVDQDETADPEADVETETTLQKERLVQCISDCF